MKAVTRSEGAFSGLPYEYVQLGSPVGMTWTSSHNSRSGGNTQSYAESMRLMRGWAQTRSVARNLDWRDEIHTTVWLDQAI